MLENYPDVLTTTQVAEIFGICENTARKRMREGKKKSKKVGQKHYATKESIIELLK